MEAPHITSLVVGLSRKAVGLTFAFTVLFSLVATLYCVSLVCAAGNPWPPTPNNEPPKLTLQAPKNNSAIYASGTVDVAFAVTTPSSWLTVGDNGVPLGEVTSIQIYLDENIVAQFEGYRAERLPKSFSAALNNLTWGQHTLNVTVNSNSYYNPIFPHFHGNVAVNPITVSDVIYITVGNFPSPTTSPTPSQNTSSTPQPSEPPNTLQLPEQNPTSSPSQSASPPVPEFPSTLILPALIALITGSSFVLKRKQHKK